MDTSAPIFYKAQHYILKGNEGVITARNKRQRTEEVAPQTLMGFFSESIFFTVCLSFY